MIVSAIVGPALAGLQRSIGRSHRMAYFNTGEWTDQGIAAELAEAAKAVCDVLVLDGQAAPADPVLEGVGRFRACQPNAQLVLLAWGRPPGDAVVATAAKLDACLVLMGERPGEPERAVAAALSRIAACRADSSGRNPLPDTVRLDNPGRVLRSPPPLQQQQETWRVLAGDDRPLLVAVAGICPAADATDLSWRLATTLAERGVQVALLADLPSHLVAQLPDEFRGTGVNLAIHGYDRSPPPVLSPEEMAQWQPMDRITVALQVMVLAAVVIVDLGDLAGALAREPQVLAVADKTLIVWPQSELRLWQSARQLLSLRTDGAVRSVLARATHCAYPSTAEGAETVQAVLHQTVDNLSPPVAAVPTGPQGPDLRPLLQLLAPFEGRKEPNGRDLLAALKGRATGDRKVSGGGFLRWLRPFM